MHSKEWLFVHEIIESRRKVLRSIVAIKDISKGEMFSINNVGVKRTLAGRAGSEPKYFDDVIGLIANKNFKINDPITLEEIL